MKVKLKKCPLLKWLFVQILFWLLIVSHCFSRGDTYKVVNLGDGKTHMQPSLELTLSRNGSPLGTRKYSPPWIIVPNWRTLNPRTHWATFPRIMNLENLFQRTFSHVTPGTNTKYLRIQPNCIQ